MDRIIEYKGEKYDLDNLLERYNYYNGRDFTFRRCSECKKGTKHHNITVDVMSID